MFPQILSFMSLEGFDQPWGETLEHSLLLKPWWVLRKSLPKFADVASLMQKAGFAVSVILFICLALPQFANDKEGLALIAMGGFALWLGGYLLGGSERRTPSSLDAIVIVYLAANVISALASHYLAESIHGLLKVVVYILSYFYLTSLLQGRPDRKAILLSALALTALAVSMYGFWQYHNHVEPLATWEDPTVENKGTRIFSTLGNPNLLAGYLLPLIALCASLGAAAIAAKRWLIGVPVLGIAALIAVATVLTGSRGAYIGLFALAVMIVILAVSVVWRDTPKLRIPMIGAVVIGAIGLVAALHFVPGFDQRITSIFAGREHSSNAFRMNVWHSSWEMFKDNWWFGIGPGNQTFRLAYGLYMTSGFDALGTYCVPLEVGVETGLLGMFAFFSLVAACMARGHVAFWSGRGWQKWLTAGAAVALASMMIHGVVDTVFYRPQVQFIFWLVIAMLTTARDEHKRFDS